MNFTRAIFVVSDEVRAIRVSYDRDESTKRHHLLKTLDAHIQKGDHVVVATGTRHGMTVCKVEEVDVDVDLDSNEDMRWSLGRVDKERNDAIVEQEAQLIAKLRRGERERRRKQLREDYVTSDMAADVDGLGKGFKSLSHSGPTIDVDAKQERPVRRETDDSPF